MCDKDNSVDKTFFTKNDLKQDTLIRKTKSVCPICLKTLDAELHFYLEKEQSIAKEWAGVEDTILLTKHCEEHGTFSSIVWQGTPNYFDWTAKQIEHDEIKYLRPLQLSSKECPQNCGLCSEHKQSSCTVLVELTDRCNLSCPICFANSQRVSSDSIGARPTSHIPLENLFEQLEWIAKTAGKVILQLSGGEPTLYPHLLDLIKKAASLFAAVQLNTNGILLGQDKNLAKELKQAGLSWVFLQFDAPDNAVHIALRGKKLQDIKEKAIENCKKAGLAVVLVSVLVRGVNDYKLGDLVEFALQHYPTVRGVHFQPMTKSGRNFKKECAHITLPEVISLLAEQSKGQIKKEHAHAPDCEHTMCAFHCRYFVDNDLKLQYIYDERQKENPYKKRVMHDNIINLSNQTTKELEVNKEGYAVKQKAKSQNTVQKNTLEILQNAPKRSIESVIRAWKGDKNEEDFAFKKYVDLENKANNKRENNFKTACIIDKTRDLAHCKIEDESNNVGKHKKVEDRYTDLNAFDAFIEKARKHIFSITCMAFQDVHTLDLQRLQQCCVHIYAQKNGQHALVPFCAYNLTSLSGNALYRRQNEEFFE